MSAVCTTWRSAKRGGVDLMVTVQVALFDRDHECCWLYLTVGGCAALLPPARSEDQFFILSSLRSNAVRSVPSLWQQWVRRYRGYIV